jgi:hypothetical protein
LNPVKKGLNGARVQKQTKTLGQLLKTTKEEKKAWKSKKGDELEAQKRRKK